MKTSNGVNPARLGQKQAGQARHSKKNSGVDAIFKKDILIFRKTILKTRDGYVLQNHAGKRTDYYE